MAELAIRTTQTMTQPVGFCGLYLGIRIFLIGCFEHVHNDRKPMNSASQTSVASLPSYKSPPVDEVVCGYRFEPLSQLKVVHIGLLWEKFRNDFPNVQHAAPISTDGSIFVDETTGIPLPRVWFISKADNELIQFQPDRLSIIGDIAGMIIHDILP